MNQFTKIIAAQLKLKEQAVENTLALLEEGCTIPFISRYRKEKTGNMDEVSIEAIAQANEKLKEMAKRKETILKTIDEQGKLTDALKKRIEDCWDATELEDIYLPYKPKRRTRAQIAREQGLEPLAQILLLQRERNIMQAAKRFVGDKVADVDAAIQGAKDIIAETVSENEESRNAIRGEFRRGAIITSKVVAKKKDEEEAQRFSDYFDFSEPLKRCSSHRLLAMRRGEAAGILRVSISADDEQCTDKLKRHYVHGYGESQTLVGEAVDDAFKRLLKPSIETEFAALSKQKADEEAIVVFADNLRQLLLAAPLGQKRVMAVDPGFANGCKTACLDAQGNLIHHEIVFPHPPRSKRMEATAAIKRMVRQYQVEAMAVGNGTASRETSDWLHEIEFDHPVDIYVVSEDGASIYSASTFLSVPILALMSRRNILSVPASYVVTGSYCPSCRFSALFYSRRLVVTSRTYDSEIRNRCLVRYDHHITAIMALLQQRDHVRFLHGNAARRTPVLRILAVQEDRGATLVDGRVHIEADGHRVLIADRVLAEMLSADRRCALHPAVVRRLLAGPPGVRRHIAPAHLRARI